MTLDPCRRRLLLLLLLLQLQLLQHLALTSPLLFPILINLHPKTPPPEVLSAENRNTPSKTSKHGASATAVPPPMAPPAALSGKDPPTET